MSDWQEAEQIGCIFKDKEKKIEGQSHEAKGTKTLLNPIRKRRKWNENENTTEE